MSDKFKIEIVDGSGRAGKLYTSHGIVDTPAFMPVATQGSVKALDSRDIESIGANIILSNTYHLMLRPGIQTLKDLGGLHVFMDWNKPILTDSGGFQTFSLGKLSHITEEGVTFRSHIDGSSNFLSPEMVIEYQELLGVDIAMVLDQCSQYGLIKEEVLKATDRTHSWASRSKLAHKGNGQSLFGIIQGGGDLELRRYSVNFLTSLDFDGYAIGGMSVGEPKQVMYETVELMGQILPYEKPRYLMGVGSPEDLVECVYRGVDLFDCVLPSRVARNGSLMTVSGRVNILNKAYKTLDGPVDENCNCYTCKNFSAAYLNHLFKAHELSGYRLATIHNLRFILKLMEDLRVAIQNNKLDIFREEFMYNYRSSNEAVRLSQKEKWMKNKLGH
jgi:queuine tRNA-ribosyltransferase